MFVSSTSASSSESPPELSISVEFVVELDEVSPISSSTSSVSSSFKSKSAPRLSANKSTVASTLVFTIASSSGERVLLEVISISIGGISNPLVSIPPKEVTTTGYYSGSGLGSGLGFSTKMYEIEIEI